MSHKVRLLLIASFAILFLANCNYLNQNNLEKKQKVELENKSYFAYSCDPKVENVELAIYLKDSIHNITDLVAKKNDLQFAMNGGIFEPDWHTTGLLIKNSEIIDSLNNRNGSGNYYLKPNAVFELKYNGIAKIVESSTYEYKLNETKLAIQSGPALVLENAIHPAFNEGSNNKRIRNGIGIDDVGHLHFILTKDEINLFDFASIFKNDFKCKNALYLDGVISEMYNKKMGKTVGFSHEFASILYVESH